MPRISMVGVDDETGISKQDGAFVRGAERGVAGKSLHPAFLGNLGDEIRAGGKASEFIGAVRTRRGGALACVQGAVLVLVEEDRPALQSRLVLIACAVAVAVQELQTANGCRLVVAEVTNGHVPADYRDRVVEVG